MAHNQQLPGGPKTINEEFFDALVRHQIGLLRLTGSIRKEVFALLALTEQDMVDKIISRLTGHEGLNTPADVRRMQSLLKSIRATRLTAWSQIDELWLRELIAVSLAEPGIVDQALKTVVPVVLETTLPAAALLKSIVATRPFQGKTMRQWSRNISRVDIERIEGQIRIGMVQGESSQAIARRVVGTRVLQGKDGVTEITRRQAAALTRTAVNAISNQARREFFRANATMFTEELYVATLDSVTTPICRSLDGRRFSVAEGPIPPLHFNCRSLRVGIIDGEVIGQRPMREFTEPQMVREFSRSAGLKPLTRRAQLPHGTKGRFDKFKARRVRELTGRVPAKVSYQEWLIRQSREFQDDVLGQTKGVLFRKGGLKLDKFVNRKGDELTLNQLATTQAQAFRSAGLNPEDFL